MAINKTRMRRMDMIRESVNLAEMRVIRGGSPQWGRIHANTWREASNGRGKGHAVALVKMIEGLALYADAHAEAWGNVNDDTYCDTYYRQIGEGIIKLLSGPGLDGLDLGTIDGLLRQMGACEECE